MATFSSIIIKLKQTHFIFQNIPNAYIIYSIVMSVTCDFQQCGILTSVDSGELVQTSFKLRNSKWCSVRSLTVIEYSSD